MRIPRELIEWRVARRAVTEPDESVADFIRAWALVVGERPASAERWAEYGVKMHRANRGIHGAIVAGRIGKGRA